MASLHIIHYWVKSRNELRLNQVELFHFKALHDFCVYKFDKVYVNLMLDDINDTNLINFIMSSMSKYLNSSNIEFNVCKNNKNHEYNTLHDLILPTIRNNEYDYIFYSHIKGLSYLDNTDEEYQNILFTEYVWSYVMYKYCFNSTLLKHLKENDKIMYGMLDPNDYRIVSEEEHWASLWNSYIWNVINPVNFPNYHNATLPYDKYNYAFLGSFFWVNVKRYNEHCSSKDLSIDEMIEFLSMLPSSINGTSYKDLATHSIEYMLPGILPLDEMYTPTSENERQLAEIHMNYDFAKTHSDDYWIIQEFSEWSRKSVCITFPTYLKDRETYQNAHIGDYTYAGENFKIKQFNTTPNVIIGKYCSIGNDVTINCMSHDIDRVSTYPFYSISDFYDFDVAFSDEYEKENRSNKDVTIGNAVWIADNVTILGGLTIGNGAVICTGSVVTHDVQPYEMVGGIPARHICYLFDERQIQSLENIAWWDWNDDVVKERTKDLLSKNINEFIEKYEATNTCTIV